MDAETNVGLNAQAEGSGAGPAWPPRSELKILNTDLVRVDARAKVTGRAKYTHDVRVEGLAYARLLLAPVPALDVKTLDVKPALKVPGVLAAIVIEDSKASYLGQPLAAVAATTPERAEDGLRAIRFEYTPRRWAVDHAQATAADAPKIRKKAPEPAVKGDEEEASKALAGAAEVVEGEYSVPVQHHACLETHGAVVDYRGGDEATVYCSTQATFAFAPDAADELGLKTSNVTGLVDYMGGGFGAKFGLGAEGQAACKLARELKRPVHLMLTRQDEFLMAGNRSGGRCSLRLGAARDGKLVGLASKRWKHGGLGDGSMAGHPYVYAVDKSWSWTVAVPTNMDSNRAMRAPGHPQSAFPMESAIDELAYRLGLDPLEIRKKNLKDEVWHRQLDRVAHEIGWHAHPHRTAPGDPKQRECVGIGFAIATWGPGSNPGNEVEVRIEKDGSVTSSVGSQDLGTGVRTYVAAIVAEELGLELGQVTARIGSTKLPLGTGSGGSATTGSLAPAVKVAAYNAARAFSEALAPTFGIPAERLRFVGGQVVDREGQKPALTWAQACATLPSEGLRAKGAHKKGLAGGGIHGAQAVKVRVHTDTGQVEVLEMVGIQDCGLPLNRAAVRSQINGGMIQALSYGLLEERVVDPELGAMLNANFEDYKLLGTLEMPVMRAIVDDADTRGTLGIAEACIIPGHSALANAVFNACGARIRHLPLTPDKVLAALGKVV